MRDARTRGETPLHRAAAFGTEETIDLLRGAGARPRRAKDAHGDTPLSWGSWYARPDADPEEAVLRGAPHPPGPQADVRQPAGVAPRDGHAR